MTDLLNPHYDYNCPNNKACIEHMQAYDEAWFKGDSSFLKKAEKTALYGVEQYVIGIAVNSPWGNNTVLKADIRDFGDDKDVVQKEITVQPGFMLSLQRHRGRDELWEIKTGSMTVILNGEIFKINADKNIKLPKGSIHCMANLNDDPITVIETQTGTCREADNIRLLDFNNRPTIPLSCINEAQSAILYAQIHNQITEKFGLENAPHKTLLEENFQHELVMTSKSA